MIPWWHARDAVYISSLNLAIFPFGVLVAIGVLCGSVGALWRSRRMGLDPNTLLEFILYVLIIAFLGSHIFHVLFYSPSEFLQNPLTLLNPFGSQSSVGGFLSAFLGAYIWKLKTKSSPLEMYDQLSFWMPVGWFFGRLGCFVVHDHPGELTTFFLGVKDYQFVGLETGTRHDLGLYEMIWSFVMFVWFLKLDKKIRPFGYFTILFFTTFSFCRFWLDFLRVNDPHYFGLTVAQWICILTTATGIYFFGRINKKSR
jgi:phosphatidylglycerol:prolipoprotein diacylglycerol transferase